MLARFAKVCTGLKSPRSVAWESQVRGLGVPGPWLGSPSCCPCRRWKRHLKPPSPDQSSLCRKTVATRDSVILAEPFVMQWYSRQVANHPSLVIFVVFSLATTAIVASLTLWELPSFTDPPQGECTLLKDFDQWPLLANFRSRDLAARTV
ncbi:hypothetical protein MRX96_050512 [Rhipicephalus microplus]